MTVFTLRKKQLIFFIFPVYAYIFYVVVQYIQYVQYQYTICHVMYCREKKILDRGEEMVVANDADTLRRYAAILGATGIAAGAFGAHALRDTLTKRGSVENWRTAVLYHLLHASALLALSSNKPTTSTSSSVLAGKLMTTGTVLFSGSVYMLSLGIGPKRLLGPTTPIGGLFMIAGWVVLAF